MVKKKYPIIVLLSSAVYLSNVKKLLLICTLMLLVCFSYGQDTLKLKLIDAFVASVNSSALKRHVDSSTLELTAGKPFKKTYITLYYKDSATLFKAVTKIIMFPYEAYGLKDTSSGESIIYYKDNKMVKTEESFTDGKRESVVLASYFDDLMIYSSKPKEEDDIDRTPILKQLANGYLNAFLKMKLK